MDGQAAVTQISGWLLCLAWIKHHDIVKTAQQDQDCTIPVRVYVFKFKFVMWLMVSLRAVFREIPGLT